jgi:CAAX prenyl protease-like protein
MGILQDRDARIRVLPFVVFIALLALRGVRPDDSAPLGIDSRVLYALQAGAAGALLLLWWRGYAELLRPPRLGPLALSVGVGLAVCWVWVTLDEPWMRIGEASASFEPIGDDGRLLWGLIAVRWLGATLVVPVMEELFWRGFLMRWLERVDFTAVDARSVGLRAVLASTCVFTLAHTEWLAAAIAGLAYAQLYRATGSLWTAVVAHAVTNGVLGAWVVLFGHWRYW